MARILIADNSKFSAGLMDNIISTAGNESIRAVDGIDVIEKVYRHIPACVIFKEDLPVLSGIGAASFLRSRRGTMSIPLLLLYDGDNQPHVPPGIFDAIIQVNADDDGKLEAALAGIAGTHIDEESINSDAPGMIREKIMELAMEHLEEMLSTADFLNRLGVICQTRITSIKDLAGMALELLSEFIGIEIAVILTEQWKRAMAYVFVGRDVYRVDVDDFMSVSLGDFYTHFQGLNLDDIKTTFYNNEDRNDFDRLRIDSKKISSYLNRSLTGEEKKIVGTIHLGSFTNNYFSDEVANQVDRFLDGLGPAFESALKYSVEYETRHKIHHVFSKFIPEEIIKSLVAKDTDEELMVGEKRRIVVLFSDIRSFTTITETNHPEDVVKFLNNYFDLQVAIIKKYGGNIDKFIGDAIFAIFGAPISYENNVERAVKSAMEMIQVLDQLHVSHMNIPGGDVKIGIGLHEGDAIVGNIGSSTKFDYTAIGDTVNLAARLEGYTKHYKRQVLMSENVSRKIEENYPVREVDYVKVKGKDVATSIFAIEFDPKIMEAGYLNEYYKAYKMYKLGNFATALEYYNNLKKINEDDAILDIFIERCRQFIEDPPESWDGALTLGFK